MRTKEDKEAGFLPPYRVLDLTDGYGCDVYIEASGAGPAVPQGLQMIRKLGTFVEFSVHASPVAVDWSIIGDAKELNIHGAHLGPYCYPKAIRYISDGTVVVVGLDYDGDGGTAAQNVTIVLTFTEG